MTQSNDHRSTWWGRYVLEAGQTAQWTINALNLAVQRLPNEWQLAYDQDDLVDPETTGWSHSLDWVDLGELNWTNTERHVLLQTGDTLWLRPILADRPVVTRPVTPLFVPAGEDTTIFVSTPLWLSLEVGEPPKSLKEVPIRRLSDTWFGPSTMEGELCYAGRTFARVSLENIPRRVHRAITQVTVHNRAASQLLIERLSLPVPYLSLFETSDGSLWTQAVTLVRTRDTGEANLHVEPEPPDEAKQASLISEPRQQPGHQTVIRAFGALFR